MRVFASKTVALLLASGAAGCAQLPPDLPSPGAPNLSGQGLRSAELPPSLTTSNRSAGAPDRGIRLAGAQEPAAGAQVPPMPRPARPDNLVAKPSDAAPAVDPLPEPTLADLEDLTDRVNPILRRDRAQIEAARGNAVQAGLFPNPHFDTNNPQVINGRQSLLNAGFQQEIPVMGKKKLDESAANEGTRQAEIAYLQNRAALHALVRQQFYAVLVDQERIAVLTETLALVRKSYETGQARQKAGDVGQADVRLLLVDYQRAQAALRNAEAILDGDRKQLEALVGSPGIIRGPVRGHLTGGYPEFDEHGMIEFVTKNHTQILTGLSIVRQNRILLRRAEVEPYPNPYLGPAYQFGLVPGNDQFWFNISFPIPTWDRNQGNIRQARANVIAASESINAARLNLVNQVADLLSQYRAARATIERYEGSGKDEPGILANANDAVRIVQVQYANKVTDLATLLQAQRSAIQANSDYVDALGLLWSNATQLSGLLQLERLPVEPAPAPEAPRPMPKPVEPAPAPVPPK